MISYEKLKQAYHNHKNKDKWLTKDVAYEYYHRALALDDNLLMVGERYDLRNQLMEEYQVTEIEATNILRGYGISDYVQKYENIQNYEKFEGCDKKKKFITSFESDEREV